MTRRKFIAGALATALPAPTSCPYYKPIIINTRSGWSFDYANKLILKGSLLERGDFYSVLQRELRND